MEFFRQDYSRQTESNPSKVATLEAVLSLIIGIIGIVGNLLISIIIIKDKKFHKMAFYFILNLAIVDFLTCILLVINTFVIYALVNTDESSDTIAGIIYCKLFYPPYYFFTMLIQIGVYSLVSIAIERFVSFTTLTQSGGNRKVTKIQAGVIIALAWILGTAMIAYLTRGVAIEDGKCVWKGYPIEIGIISLLARYMIPSLIMIVLYGRVIYVLRKQTKDFDKSEQTAAASSLNAARRKITIILIVVTGAFIILWLPRSIIVFMPPNVVGQIGTTVLIVAHINSIINPLIYFIGFPGFRRAFRETFCSPIFRAIGRDLPETTTTRKSTLATLNV